MNVKTYDGKDEKELLASALEELGVEESQTLHYTTVTKGGLLKKDTYTLHIATIDDVVDYMKTYLNSLGVTTYNLSQYNTNNKNKFNSRLLDKGLMIIKKPEIKINKNMNKFENNSFFKACEHFPCIIALSIKCFFKEGFFDLFKLNIGSNCDNNKNKNKKINSDNNEIKLYIKKKEENKYFKGNNKELSDNKNNKENLNQKNSDTPKNIEMRNIPEEERIIVENMFQENEDSDQDDILD